MKSLTLKTFLLAGLMYLGAGTVAFAALEKTTLLQGLQKKKVSMTEICSNGGYIGKCLSLSLKNHTRNPIEVHIDPALIFRPGDGEYQHLVAVGEEQVTIPPGEIRNVSLQTFCGKASASSPRNNLKYSFWKQGSPSMIQASQYIREHKLYSYIGQHAIWMFTDNHSLRNIYDPSEADKSKTFVSFLAKATRQEMPQFYAYHKINTTINGRGPVYDKQVTKIYVDIDWKGILPRNAHVLVLDAKRQLYRTIVDGEVINSKGQHTIKVTLDPKIDPPGIYYVQLKDDESNIRQEKKAIL